MLEPPHRGVSNEYQQSMFWNKNKKIRYTFADPRLLPNYPPNYYIKLGYKGVYISRTCFPDDSWLCFQKGKIRNKAREKQEQFLEINLKVNQRKERLLISGMFQSLKGENETMRKKKNVKCVRRNSVTILGYSTM